MTRELPLIILYADIGEGRKVGIPVTYLGNHHNGTVRRKWSSNQYLSLTRSVLFTFHHPIQIQYYEINIITEQLNKLKDHCKSITFNICKRKNNCGNSKNRCCLFSVKISSYRSAGFMSACLYEICDHQNSRMLQKKLIWYGRHGLIEVWIRDC